MKRHIWLVLVLLFSIKSYAQEEIAPKPLHTDRPGQSITPYTAGDRALQLQGGYAYSKETSNFADSDLHSVDLNPKLGIGDRFEISVLFQISSLKEERWNFLGHSISSDEPDNGLSVFAFSVRRLVMKGEGLKPAIGVEATYINSGVPGEDPTNSNGRFILTMQNQLLEKLSFTGNVIYYTDNQTEFTANLGYSITNRFGVFAEYWPIFEAVFDGDSGLILQDSYMNTGVFWQLGDNFQLDAAGGFRVGQPELVDKDSESYYLQVGLTKRFWLNMK